MLNILFPTSCNACKNRLLHGEHIMCGYCLHLLPMLCFHRTNDPKMKNIFYGRLPLEQATCLLKFEKKGRVQELLHRMKYKNRPEISNFFGKWLGTELAELPEYQKIDLVLPVPLHKKRLKQRGYNQVSGFGKEIANKLGVPFREDILKKVGVTPSQVFRKRASRVHRSEHFLLEKEKTIDGKHILLVDDIVTTGATLEGCALELLKSKGVRISVATIAMTC